MGRGIIHRKVQTNRARELEAPDHQRAGIGGMALSSMHRDNPDSVYDMLRTPPPPAPSDFVMVPRDAFDELVARVLALENVTPGSAPQNAQADK
jgi:hypothetical protein